MAHSDWFEVVADELLFGESDISEASLRTSGTNVNRFASAIAAAAEMVEFELIREVAGLFLDTARGDALSRLVASDIGVQKHGETASRVELTFSRTGTDALTIEAGAIVATAGGVRFALDQDVAWSEGDSSDKVGEVTCTVTGTTGNVPAGAITIIETSLDDPTVTVSQAVAAAGGAPAESDEALLDRVRDFVARQRRGTVEALRIGALETPSVRTVDVHESLGTTGLETGGAYVIIGDDAGRANTLLLEDVRTELRRWRPAGVFVKVTASQIAEQPIALTATWAPGQATAANVAALRRAVVARVNNLVPRSAPEGADIDIACLLRHAIIHEAARTVPGCRGVEVTLPVGTVQPDFGQVIRTRFSLVTVN